MPGRASVGSSPAPGPPEPGPAGHAGGPAAASGIRPERRILEFAFVPADERVREVLGVAQVLRVRRVNLADGEPFAIVTVWCPAELAQHLSRADVERSPFYELLPAPLGGATQTIAADAATPEDAGPARRPGRVARPAVRAGDADRRRPAGAVLGPRLPGPPDRVRGRDAADGAVHRADRAAAGGVTAGGQRLGVRRRHDDQHDATEQQQHEYHRADDAEDEPGLGHAPTAQLAARGIDLLDRPSADHHRERRDDAAGQDADDAEDQGEGGAAGGRARRCRRPAWPGTVIGPGGAGGGTDGGGTDERWRPTAAVYRPKGRAAVAVAVARCSWRSTGGQASLPVTLLAASLALSATSSPAALALSATSSPGGLGLGLGDESPSARPWRP